MDLVGIYVWVCVFIAQYTYAETKPIFKREIVKFSHDYQFAL